MRKTMMMTIQLNTTEELFRDLHEPESCAEMTRDIDACDNTKTHLGSFSRQGPSWLYIFGKGRPSIL